MKLNQGDIIRVEGAPVPIFVASTKVFNKAEMIVGCPVMKSGETSALHYRLAHSKADGVVYCEQLKYFDLSKRNYSLMADTNIKDSMEIVDIIQGIFEYSVGQQ